MKTTTQKLKVGKRYDLSTLGLAWEYTDGGYGDREVSEWFDEDGTYRGPDEDGVEPLFLIVGHD
jgi:hypothetical protein